MRIQLSHIFPLLIFIVHTQLIAGSFGFIVRDVDLNGTVDFIQVENGENIVEIEAASGRISRFFLGNRKFKTDLLPSTPVQGSGVGLIYSKGELQQFSYDKGEVVGDEIIVNLINAGFRRQYRFIRDKYYFRSSIEPLSVNGEAALVIGPYLSPAANPLSGSEVPGQLQFSWFGEKRQALNLKKALSTDPGNSSPFYSLIADYYNLTILPARPPLSVRIEPAGLSQDDILARDAILSGQHDAKKTLSLLSELYKNYKVQKDGVNIRLNFSTLREVEFTVFCGPNDRELLQDLHAQELISYGFFSSIAQVLMVGLRFFYRFTSNWGIAIILLTVVIKILLHPLTIKQTRSMEEMKKVQPIINSLRDRHKNDPQKLNAEIMNVYKDHKVNPFGGCLPILVQLPILFALFTVLRISIDLKGESFLWIPDLALADPTLFLPILVAVTMFYQQKNMPSTDPQQQSMMMIMPVMMFFFAKALAAGVVLYWFVSNLLGVIEQQAIAKRMSSGQVKNPREARKGEKGK
ncbi:MAG: membrane protein insertase YidC [Candidatus Wallbacteria bacterium]|nr:membrane protein insertase YidC [Candidatus Wallbacteria bacterium]